MMAYVHVHHPKYTISCSYTFNIWYGKPFLSKIFYRSIEIQGWRRFNGLDLLLFMTVVLEILIAGGFAR